MGSIGNAISSLFSLHEYRTGVTRFIQIDGLLEVARLLGSPVT
jgi:hypothetical protein